MRRSQHLPRRGIRPTPPRRGPSELSDATARGLLCGCLLRGAPRTGRAPGTAKAYDRSSARDSTPPLGCSHSVSPSVICIQGPQQRFLIWILNPPWSADRLPADSPARLGSLSSMCTQVRKSLACVAHAAGHPLPAMHRVLPSKVHMHASCFFL